MKRIFYKFLLTLGFALIRFVLNRSADQLKRMLEDATKEEERGDESGRNNKEEQDF